MTMDCATCCTQDTLHCNIFSASEGSRVRLSYVLRGMDDCATCCTQHTLHCKRPYLMRQSSKLDLSEMRIFQSENV